MQVLAVIDRAGHLGREPDGRAFQEAAGKTERPFVDLVLHLRFGRQRIGLGRRVLLLRDRIAAAVEQRKRGEQAST
jgi:hypothetical protein